MELPANIGKYELQEFLGGGMSHVYRAVDTVIGRTVAVKILTEAGCADEEAKARFLQEARMAGNIAHDNIINIYDFGEDDQHRPFMVMEFLRGEDLRHAIKNGHTGDIKSKLKIALQVARALEYIHSQKIIHRDIKPENVHLTPNGVVKLMDFGIAKTEGLSMTRAGYVLGTPYYMAPEQVLGKQVTDLVDVYAFGIMLFELMVGVKPIAGDTVERIFYSILNEPLNLEPLAQAGVPPTISNLVAHCTAKDPAQRPQGFGPVCEEIQQFLASMEAAERPAVAETAPPPARKNWVIPVAVLVAVVAIVGLYFALRPRSEPSQQAKLPATITTPTGDMELVPAGPFLFGENKESVQLSAFYIDKTTVTNAAYEKFCEATHRALPEGFSKDKPNYPVVNVTIIDAQEFAKWAGKRLPTSREWAKAARGTDGRLFPWGNQHDPKLAAVSDNPDLHLQGPVPVDSFQKGASPYHVLQMVGNVWQFVDQLSTPTPNAKEVFAKILNPPPGPDDPWYTIRGGAFDVPLSDRVLFDWTTVPVRWHYKDIGFRCVKDAQ